LVLIVEKRVVIVEKGCKSGDVGNVVRVIKVKIVVKVIRCWWG
jgi:hypothetical protein